MCVVCLNMNHTNTSFNFFYVLIKIAATQMPNFWELEIDEKLVSKYKMHLYMCGTLTFFNHVLEFSDNFVFISSI